MDGKPNAPPSEPPDVEAVNPRYGTAKMSDIARALLRPKNPAARAALERLQEGKEHAETTRDR